MKRIIAAIIMTLFVLTQTGISYALRQENYEAPAEGGASGIGDNNRAKEILFSLANPFVWGWQQARAVAYTPHEKNMKAVLKEAFSNHKPVNIEMHNGERHNNVIVAFRPAIDMFGVIDAKGKDKGYLPVKVQDVKQISYVKATAPAPNHSLHSDSGQAQAAGVTVEQARRVIDAIIEVDEAKKKLGGQGVIIGQKADTINATNWLEEYYLPRIFWGRPKTETLQFMYASRCIADEGVGEYNNERVKGIISHGKNIVIAQAKERALGKYVGVVGIDATETPVVRKWLEETNVQSGHIREFETRELALEALAKEDYIIIERAGNSFSFITAAGKIEIVIDSWLPFEKLRPKFDWALAQSI